MVPPDSWGVVTDTYIPPLLGPEYTGPECQCSGAGGGSAVLFRITEGGDIRITENGDERILE